MSLKDRIERERKTLHEQKLALAELRDEFQAANFKRRNDHRFENESDKHWKRRRKRNRERVERKDEATDVLAKKVQAQEQLIDDLREHRREWKEAKAEDRDGFKQDSTAIVTFDGKPLVEDLAYWLQLIRDKNLWNGYLTSGYRTPEYSEGLCYSMCGQPSCPGRCAGRASNHAKTTYPGPAADVSDYYNAEKALIAVGSPYSNDLPIDPVHMSRSGH